MSACRNFVQVISRRYVFWREKKNNEFLFSAILTHIPEKIAFKKKKKKIMRIVKLLFLFPHMLQNCLIWMKGGGCFLWIFKDSFSNCT